ASNLRGIDIRLQQQQRPTRIRVSLHRSVRELTADRRGSDDRQQHDDHTTPKYTSHEHLAPLYAHFCHPWLVVERICEEYGDDGAGGRERGRPKAPQRGCRVGDPAAGRGAVSVTSAFRRAPPGSPPRGFCAVGWLGGAVRGQALRLSS